MDQDYLHDLFADFGPVTIRKLFGGWGLYVDGLIFACVIRDEIRIKADEISAPEFEAAGAKPWVYEHKGSKKPVTMPYWHLPDAALDDTEEVARWARLGRQAALRAQTKEPARRPAKPESKRKRPARKP